MTISQEDIDAAAEAEEIFGPDVLEVYAKRRAERIAELNARIAAQEEDPF